MITEPRKGMRVRRAKPSHYERRAGVRILGRITETVPYLMSGRIDQQDGYVLVHWDRAPRSGRHSTYVHPDRLEEVTTE